MGTTIYRHGDLMAADRLIGIAKKQLRILDKHLAWRDLQTGSRKLKFLDGSLIIVSRLFSHYKINIYVPVGEEEKAFSDERKTSSAKNTHGTFVFTAQAPSDLVEYQYILIYDDDLEEYSATKEYEDTYAYGNVNLWYGEVPGSDADGSVLSMDSMGDRYFSGLQGRTLYLDGEIILDLDEITWDDEVKYARLTGATIYDEKLFFIVSNGLGTTSDFYAYVNGIEYYPCVPYDRDYHWERVYYYPLRDINIEAEPVLIGELSGNRVEKAELAGAGIPTGGDYTGDHYANDASGGGICWLFNGTGNKAVTTRLVGRDQHYDLEDEDLSNPDTIWPPGYDEDVDNFESDGETLKPCKCEMKRAYLEIEKNEYTGIWAAKITYGDDAVETGNDVTGSGGGGGSYLSTILPSGSELSDFESRMYYLMVLEDYTGDVLVRKHLIDEVRVDYYHLNEELEAGYYYGYLSSGGLIPFGEKSENSSRRIFLSDAKEGDGETGINVGTIVHEMTNTMVGSSSIDLDMSWGEVSHAHVYIDQVDIRHGILIARVDRVGRTQTSYSRSVPVGLGLYLTEDHLFPLPDNYYSVDWRFPVSESGDEVGFYCEAEVYIEHDGLVERKIEKETVMQEGNPNIVYFPSVANSEISFFRKRVKTCEWEFRLDLGSNSFDEPFLTNDGTRVRVWTQNPEYVQSYAAVGGEDAVDYLIIVPHGRTPVEDWWLDYEGVNFYWLEADEVFDDPSKIYRYLNNGDLDDAMYELTGDPAGSIVYGDGYWGFLVGTI